jgi:hypothetical protein
LLQLLEKIEQTDCKTVAGGVWDAIQRSNQQLARVRRLIQFGVSQASSWPAPAEQPFPPHDSTIVGEETTNLCILISLGLQAL